MNFIDPDRSNRHKGQSKYSNTFTWLCANISAGSEWQEKKRHQEAERKPITAVLLSPVHQLCIRAPLSMFMKQRKITQDTQILKWNTKMNYFQNVNTSV